MLLLGILTQPLLQQMNLPGPKTKKREVHASYVDLQILILLAASLQLYHHRNHQELELDPISLENALPLRF
jgi:hypothetical protein